MQTANTTHPLIMFGNSASVYSERAVRIGAITQDGRVFTVAGAHVGTVGPDGQVCTPQGMLLGWATPSGQVVDRAGQPLTQLRPDGGVESQRHRYIGYVTRQLSLQLRAGAALLLLPVAE